MLRSVSLLIGLRYAKSNKGSPFLAFINRFSVTGIALGLMALIIVSSVMNGFESQLKQRVLGVLPHFVVDNADPQWRQSFAARSGVDAVTEFLEVEAVIMSASELKPVYVHGVEPQSFDRHSIVAKNMLLGAITDLSMSKYAIVLGRPLAVALNVRLGDQVRVLAPGTSVYGPMGRMPAQRKFIVTGIFDVGSEMDDKVAIMHIRDTRRLLRIRDDSALQSRIYLQDAFEYLPIKQQLQAQQLAFRDWRERQGPLFDAVKMEKNMMALMLLLIIAVAAFNVVSTLVMLVTEKQADIAILRTQGMTAENVMTIFLLNGMYNGVKGTSIGAILGLLVATQLNSILLFLGVPMSLFIPGETLPVAVQPLQILSLILMSLLLCFLATLYPAYKALRLQPASALKQE